MVHSDEQGVEQEWQKTTWKNKKLLTKFKKEGGRGLSGRTVIAQACRDAVSITEFQLELELARDMQDKRKRLLQQERLLLQPFLYAGAKQGSEQTTPTPFPSPVKLIISS